MRKQNIVKYTPIGVIHSPLKRSVGSPIQSGVGLSVKGRLEVFHPYIRGMAGLSGFSHLILIYDFHLAKTRPLVVRPFLDDKHLYGVFSTRAPARPNSIGISVVGVRSVRGRNIFVQDLDVIDGTPLLDIKPYVPSFDRRQTKRIGWYSGRVQKLRNCKADDRFDR
ncbi:MAG: tRNA (N6-threonylcarbamoyladenosine(37)-N6)-methyltransferase TrmO [Nitrososphaerota archaeon]|nr:tRNA (N6-threonylcarbamoyladenosine(37)-N6)-methyltransferase TrmO [Nitrososphaerota archaeon]MDG6924266.1 tRNA (N6-threonylcarbamoyladenosine(37)-N6)-methyltransferase TrmO [Nitrososphaerota archaeon]